MYFLFSPKKKLPYGTGTRVLYRTYYFVIQK